MKHTVLHFFSFVLALTVSASLLSAPLLTGAALPRRDTVAYGAPQLTVVLDAGHGGEDGGARSAPGVLEKNINLDIALRLRDLLEANGVAVVLTRSTDVLLYDRDVDYHGRKKALDLAARRKIAEETENCIFVSIHMNAFPQTQYHGLQVWYSPNHADSATLADAVQELTRSQLQPENNRRVKAATSAIYLLHHLRMPAILVECGFLSNPQEAERLATAEYREQLAFLLFLALTDGMRKISPDFAAEP